MGRKIKYHTDEERRAAKSRNNRKYYLKNKEKIRAKYKDWLNTGNNREKRRAWEREWRRKRREKMIAEGIIPDRPPGRPRKYPDDDERREEVRKRARERYHEKCANDPEYRKRYRERNNDSYRRKNPLVEKRSLEEERRAKSLEQMKKHWARQEREMNRLRRTG